MSQQLSVISLTCVTASLHLMILVVTIKNLYKRKLLAVIVKRYNFGNSEYVIFLARNLVPYSRSQKVTHTEDIAAWHGDTNTSVSVLVHCTGLNFLRPAGHRTFVNTFTCNGNLDPLHTGQWGTRWRSGWGTALQTGRSRDRFPMVSLDFFIDIILPVALWPWGRLSL
jgi:hypothetical protein